MSSLDRSRRDLPNTECETHAIHPPPCEGISMSRLLPFLRLLPFEEFPIGLLSLDQCRRNLRRADSFFGASLLSFRKIKKGTNSLLIVSVSPLPPAAVLKLLTAPFPLRFSAALFPLCSPLSSKSLFFF